MKAELIGRVWYVLRTRNGSWHVISDLALIDGKKCVVMDWSADGAPIGIIELDDQWLDEVESGDFTHSYQWPLDDPRNLQ